MKKNNSVYRMSSFVVRKKNGGGNEEYLFTFVHIQNSRRMYKTIIIFSGVGRDRLGDMP